MSRGSPTDPCSSSAACVETLSRTVFANEDGSTEYAYLTDVEYESMFYFVPASVMKPGATTLDPKLFIADADTRRWRQMTPYFFHLCNRIGEYRAPAQKPTIMTERVLVSAKGLPEELAINYADPYALLGYVTENPSAVAGYLYTFQFASDARIVNGKPRDLLEQERVDEQRSLEEKQLAFEKDASAGKPKKKPLARSDAVSMATAAMRGVYKTFHERNSKNSTPLDRELLRHVPSHSELREALYYYTSDKAYLEAPEPRLDCDFHQNDRMSPLRVFTLKNCNLDAYRIHPACVNDLTNEAPVARALCRRIRTDEVALDRFFRYRFIQFPDLPGAYEGIIASIPVDGTIHAFLDGKIGPTSPFSVCFQGFTADELKAFDTKSTAQLTSLENARLTELTTQIQQTEFNLRPEYYQSGRKSTQPPLYATTFDDLETENLAARKEMQKRCDEFNSAHPAEPELQRQHARASLLAFQRKGLARLIQVFEAGRISKGAKLLYGFLKQYKQKHHNLYFKVAGGFGGYYRDVSAPYGSASLASSSACSSTSSAGSMSALSLSSSTSSSSAGVASSSVSSASTVASASSSTSSSSCSCSSSTSSAGVRSADVLYGLPAFAHDMTASLGWIYQIAFNPKLVFEAFFRVTHVFLDRPLYLNMLVSGNPGCGKSMIGAVLKELLPEGVVTDLTHESYCAMAVSGNDAPVREDQIRILDEFGPEFMDPTSPKMRQLLSLLSGALYGYDVLQINPKSGERKNVQEQVRDRRILLAFTNFPPSAIYAAMRDRMTTWTMAPTAMQIDQLEKCMQRAVQMQNDVKAQAEKALFLERTQLYASLAMIVSKMINVHILDQPDISKAVDRLGAMNDELQSLGVSIGGNRRRQVGTEMTMLATIGDAVLRVFACLPGDARADSTQDWDSLLDVDPFLVTTEATSVFVASLTHELTEGPLESALVDCLCREVFQGDCCHRLTGVSPLRNLDESTSASSSSSVQCGSSAVAEAKEAKSVLAIPPVTTAPSHYAERSSVDSSSEAVDEALLETRLPWASHADRSPVKRFVALLSQSPHLCGKYSTEAIAAAVGRLCQSTITIPPLPGYSERRAVPILEIKEDLSWPSDGCKQAKDSCSWNTGQHVDLVVMPAVIRTTKVPKQARTQTALSSVFCNKFTTTGDYIIGITEKESPSKLVSVRLQQHPEVKVYENNPDFCPDEQTREARLALLAIPSSKTENQVSGRYPSNLPRVECKESPFVEALRNRLARLHLPQEGDQLSHFIGALWNSPTALQHAAQVARKQESTSGRMLSRRDAFRASSSLSGLVVQNTRDAARQLEENLRREELKQQRRGSTKPQPKRGSFAALFPWPAHGASSSSSTTQAPGSTVLGRRRFDEYDKEQHGTINIEEEDEQNSKRSRPFPAEATPSTSTAPKTSTSSQVRRDEISESDLQAEKEMMG